MLFLVKLRDQPSSYYQRFSRYEILPFWDHSGLIDTRIFFGKMQYPNGIKKHIWRLLQFFQGLPKLWLIFTELLAGRIKSTGPRLRLYGTSLYLKYDPINWGLKIPVLLYTFVNKTSGMVGEGSHCCLIVVDYHKSHQTDK